MAVVALFVVGRRHGRVFESEKLWKTLCRALTEKKKRDQFDVLDDKLICTPKRRVL